jgi:hypothetical protein
VQCSAVQCSLLSQQPEVEELLSQQSEEEGLLSQQAEVEELLSQQSEEEGLLSQQAEVEELLSQQPEVEELLSQQPEEGGLLSQQAEVEGLLSQQPEVEEQPRTVARRRRRRGGEGSKWWQSLLDFQQRLTEEKGLPVSRIHSRRRTEAESPRLRVRKQQEAEESASPLLREGAGEVGEENQSEEEVDRRANQHPLRRGLFTSGVSTPTKPAFTPQQQWCSAPVLTPVQGGLMPGPAWVFCPGCQGWGTLSPPIYSGSGPPLGRPAFSY